MALSAANILQAKTGSIDAATASVSLDSGTTAGSTVVIRIAAGAVPISDGDAGIPSGFELDACSQFGGVKYQFVYRKKNVAAGEGIAGSTSWDFTYIVQTAWHWRVTEWDTSLDLVDPLEQSTSNVATGASVTSLSTGTTLQNTRASTVSQAWHLWHAGLALSRTMNWSGHTNGFTEDDELSVSFTGLKNVSSWSYNFNITNGTFETTATVNLSATDSGDIFFGLIVIYAEAIPEIVAAPTVISS